MPCLPWRRIVLRLAPTFSAVIFEFRLNRDLREDWDYPFMANSRKGRGRHLVIADFLGGRVPKVDAPRELLLTTVAPSRMLARQTVPREWPTKCKGVTGWCDRPDVSNEPESKSNLLPAIAG